MEPEYDHRFSTCPPDALAVIRWYEKATVGSEGTRWDATALGRIMATDVFQTRAPGLR